MISMYNWSVDEKYFQRHNPEGYEVWRLLQLVNYGLDGEKLDKKELKKYWPKIQERIFDKDIKRYLKMTLWPPKAY